ncbi:MAG: diguanylate cyclase, partial [Deltaproteobacteria bacterium]|nr:diguanylate cyclase [Deltaproteobacteria bacterium]
MHNFPCKMLTSYRLRLFATGLCVLMLVLTVLSVYHYYENRTQVMEKIDQRLYAGGTALRYAVGDVFHNRKLQPNMALKGDYSQANDLLVQLTHDLDLKKLYTLISVDDALYQILSSDSQQPLSGGHGRFFALYPDANQDGAAAHQGAVPRYYDREDQDGSYRSLLIPYVTAGGYRYLVGASIDISLNSALAETLQRSLTQCAILLLLSFPLTALFVWPLLCQLYTHELTGLPNRARLKKDLSTCRLPQLILIDIDGFKDINHYYGIQVGDQLLISVANCLKALIPAGTRLYKLDGDEYALLCESSPRCISVDYLISRINEQRIDIEDTEFRLSVTAGVAQGTTQLIEHADLALKEAKRVLKPHKHYSSYLHTVQNSQANLLWTYKLKDAIDGDRIEAYFQPIYDNTQHKISHYETLVRLIEEDGTVVGPTF